ncbi:hypothetical protein SFC07_11170 [Corynebacterium callunae]|uniref:hypothetical protein n=1 Tax=Corynebacterium callunae TaxID=1721 RepID=UPI0039823F05
MKIKIKNFPKEATNFFGEGRVIKIGDVEIKWDTRIRAWECSLPGVGLMRSYLIGRIVDGQVLVTENIAHDHPAQGPLATRIAEILQGLLAAGEDLGEWQRTNS